MTIQTGLLFQLTRQIQASIQNMENVFSLLKLEASASVISELFKLDQTAL